MSQAELLTHCLQYIAPPDCRLRHSTHGEREREGRITNKQHNSQNAPARPCPTTKALGLIILYKVTSEERRGSKLTLPMLRLLHFSLNLIYQLRPLKKAVCFL